ncbi:AAA family ATPase [Frankia sp. Cas8]|uniref:nucleotide-binding protein n=1 Tax=unclassified Frankia TaxID=2632575 RepID=UPI003A0FD884
MISVALFNNKGGVGKTTLTYHLAHMLQRLGKNVLAVDLDPQSNLFEDRLSEAWPKGFTGDPVALRTTTAFHRWLDRIPQVFASDVLDEPEAKTSPRTYEIATLRNYQSLRPLSHDARKPMFDLRTADGALGSTQTLVNRCYDDFRSLAEKLLDRLASVQVEN